MIHNITSLPAMGHINRKKELSGEEPEDTIKTDSLSFDKDLKEIKRRASIQYYPLHIKDEEKEKTVSAKPGTIKRDNQGYDTAPFERKLQKELGSFATIQNDWDIDGLKGEIPTTKELNQIFGEVIADKSVPWEYIIDGCYSRAHVTCEKFLEKGYNCAKMYVIIGEPSMDEPTYPFPPWRLRSENKFMKAEWWYHVAAMSFAKDEKTGEIDGYIIDPAVNKKPLKASEWIKSVWTGDFPIKFDVTNADVYDPPTDNQMYPVPEDFSKEKFDKHLEDARKTNREYTEFMKKVKEDYYAHHPEETHEA